MVNQVATNLAESSSSYIAEVSTGWLAEFFTGCQLVFLLDDF